MDYAGCDPGPLGDRDTPPPSGDSELPVLKILVVDCKQGAVRAVRYSVDGNYCMTAGQDKSVKLWNPNKGRPLKTYSGHGYEVLDVKGSCDNSQIVSCSMDKTIMLWDVSSGNWTRKWRGHQAAVNCVAFNEDSSVVISGSVDTTVKIWDTRSRSQDPIQTMEECKDSVTSLDVSDHEILVGSADSRIRLYDLRKGSLDTDYVGGVVASLNFTRDGQCVLVSCVGNSVKLFDKSSGEMLSEYTGHINREYRLDCTLDHTDKFVLSGSENGQVYCWNLVEAGLEAKLDHGPGAGTVHSLAQHPSMAQLVTAYLGRICVWQNKEQEPDPEEECLSSASIMTSEPAISVGSRVVRGPDWQWGDQDGGLGHVGTVVTIGRVQHVQCPPGTVKVTWDHGQSQNYRVGYGGQYDLRLLDNGTSGIQHSISSCSQCGAAPIFGIRWTCSVCHNYHLCSKCYMNNAHDNNHTFVRHVTEGDVGVPVGERSKEKCSDIFGTYPGAVVARGPDWRFQNQDGGPGSRGVVKDIHDWSGTGGQPTSRSVVSVVWANKEDNMYCRGHKGQVHVVYLTPGRGGRAYLGHLPILGFKYEIPTKKFQIGQHVMVNVDIETLKQMQVGNGGFHGSMMEVIGKRGKVHRMTEKGLVRVQYPGNPPQNHRWAINPAALRIVHGHNVGDKVTMTSDRTKVSRYHNTSALESVLGCKGTITLIHSESSYVIDFGEGKVATIHPGCIELPVKQEDKQTVNNNCLKAAVKGAHSDVEGYLTGAFSNNDFVIIPDNSTIISCLHQAACKGHDNVILVIMKYRSNLVNERCEDKTALQIAAHEGHTIVVDRLMQFGANPSLADKSGDTAIHYAAINSRTDPILAMVNKGADVNCVNNEKRTALHIGVLNRNIEVVATLVKVGADVNIPDSSGDTPFHLAVIQGDHNIIDMLIKEAALLACNSKGHNVLHIAAVKGDVAAVEKILRQDRQIINIVSRDGQSALHLASQFPACVQTLVRCAQCDINIADTQGRTVLHVASTRLDTGLVRMLVEAGASLGCQDMLGNTPAHLVVSEGTSITAGDSLYTNSMEGMVDRVILDMILGLNISQVEQIQTCLLVYFFRHGAKDCANFYGHTVIDLIENADIRKFVQEISHRGVFTEPQNPEHEYAEIVDEAEEALEINDKQEEGAAGPNPEGECIVCSEVLPLVTFLPCGHQIACYECCQKMKKCLKCGEIVKEKKFAIKTSEETSKQKENSWELKYNNLEDKILCTICMERPKDVAFEDCGHQACQQCSSALDTCHMCRQLIQKKINLYF